MRTPPIISNGGYIDLAHKRTGGQDSWIYFKFPSYLKQIQAIDKMVKNKEGIKN